MPLVLIVLISAGLVGAGVRPVRLHVVLCAIAGAIITAGGGYLLLTEPTVIAMRGTSTLSGLTADYGQVRCDGPAGVRVPREGGTSTELVMVEWRLVCAPAVELRHERGWAVVALGQLVMWGPQVARSRRRRRLQRRRAVDFPPRIDASAPPTAAV